MKNYPLKRYFSDFLSLIYPSVCNACGRSLVSQETVLCFSCIAHLPKRHDELQPENFVMQHFWGRIPLYHASAFLHFNKGNKVQTLLHRLKYSNMPEIGIFLGELDASFFFKQDIVKDVDIVIPVPLHPEKERKRGYNQSAKYAEGLCNNSNRLLSTNNLVRTQYTDSQTKKSRVERLENMQNIFQIKNLNELEGKHILLVDDVITTGATLEACANELLKVNNLKLSVRCIAAASSF